jgi:hypothetical protein
MDTKRDMDEPVNIQLEPEDALRVLLEDRDTDGQPDDDDG